MNNQPKTYKISQKPTYDLERVIITHVDEVNNLIYFQSLDVFKFDGVYGKIENRSRVLRMGKIENDYVIHLITATIDAGFVGKLSWKARVTQKAIKLFKGSGEKSYQEHSHIFSGASQIQMHPSPAGNYYDGSNQTNFIPEVVFSM